MAQGLGRKSRDGCDERIRGVLGARAEHTGKGHDEDVSNTTRPRWRRVLSADGLGFVACLAGRRRDPSVWRQFAADAKLHFGRVTQFRTRHELSFLCSFPSLPAPPIFITLSLALHPSPSRLSNPSRNIAHRTRCSSPPRILSLRHNVRGVAEQEDCRYCPAQSRSFQGEHPVPPFLPTMRRGAKLIDICRASLEQSFQMQHGCKRKPGKRTWQHNGNETHDTALTAVTISHTLLSDSNNHRALPEPNACVFPGVHLRLQLSPLPLPPPALLALMQAKNLDAETR